MEAARNLAHLIVNDLRVRRHAAWSQQTGAARRGRRLPQKSQGIADVVAVLKPVGVHLEIEVKIGDDTMRPSQIAHKGAIESAGGIHWIVGSFEYYRELYERLEMSGRLNPK